MSVASAGGDTSRSRSPMSPPAPPRHFEQRERAQTMPRGGANVRRSLRPQSVTPTAASTAAGFPDHSSTSSGGSRKMVGDAAAASATAANALFPTTPSSREEFERALANGEAISSSFARQYFLSSQEHSGKDSRRQPMRGMRGLAETRDHPMPQRRGSGVAETREHSMPPRRGSVSAASALVQRPQYQFVSPPRDSSMSSESVSATLAHRNNSPESVPALHQRHGSTSLSPAVQQRVIQDANLSDVPILNQRRGLDRRCSLPDEQQRRVIQDSDMHEHPSRTHSTVIRDPHMPYAGTELPNASSSRVSSFSSSNRSYMNVVQATTSTPSTRHTHGHARGKSFSNFPPHQQTALLLQAGGHVPQSPRNVPQQQQSSGDFRVPSTPTRRHKRSRTSTHDEAAMPLAVLQNAAAIHAKRMARVVEQQQQRRRASYSAESFQAESSPRGETCVDMSPSQSGSLRSAPLDNGSRGSGMHSHADHARQHHHQSHHHDNERFRPPSASRIRVPAAADMEVAAAKRKSQALTYSSFADLIKSRGSPAPSPRTSSDFTVPAHAHASHQRKPIPGDIPTSGSVSNSRRSSVANTPRVCAQQIQQVPNSSTTPFTSRAIKDGQSPMLPRTGSQSGLSAGGDAHVQVIQNLGTGRMSPSLGGRSVQVRIF